jgi:signal transduction histidine kinase
LHPGDYQLEVMAATNCGMWNEQSILLPVKVGQIFYKKWWFLTSLGLLFLLFLYSMREYELYHIRGLQKLRLKISRDLHDELGASLTGIAIRSELIKEKVDSKEKDDFLNEIAIESRGAVDILSDVVWAIDSRNNGLQNVSDRMHDVLFLLLPPLDITFSFKTVETKKPIYLNQDHRRHVFLIFKEAITNITKHSNATHVDVSIVKENYKLKLIVKDNGTLISKSENSLNGNGIKNMKLRANKIKGNLKIFNDDGFTIELLFDYLH